MSTLKTAALVAAVLGGSLAAAEAQTVGPWGQPYGYGHGHYGYRQQAPVYVHPRVARKQAQQYDRFVQKYGVVQPYGYYQQPRPYWHQPRPRPHVYHYGW
jgi:hypothetical protein